MDLHLYNSLTHKKELFTPIDSPIVRLYSCGITAYDYPHIGNFRAYLTQDVIRRTLSYLGYETLHAMNVTDVGHLTSDASEGDDKIEKRAQERGVDPLELARQYEAVFWNDLEAFNIMKPDRVLRASDAIDQQIQLIEKLFEKDAAYVTAHAIYFDVTKAKDYGALSGQHTEDKLTGVRDEVVVDPDKRNSADFVLWFFIVGRYEKHILRWESPWGVGFPGWHLECSAISRELLGQPFDIHLGGIDHIPVHHTNEIAQSQTAYDTPLANYWIHNNFITIDGQKMSKSLNNTYTHQDLIDNGISPMAFRYFSLNAHYRSQQNVTWQALHDAQDAYRHLLEYAYILHTDVNSEAQGDTVMYVDRFTKALTNDVNAPEALASAWALVKDTSIAPLSRYATLLSFDDVLGLSIAESIVEFNNVPEAISQLAREREEARQKKDYEKADQLRDEIASHGYDLRDTPNGPIIFPKMV
ncbi:MAG: cysteine--tRNA ligase [bacterium]|nr:cysteine--tRNA ligase [bacterium]